jgi:hypothetical protein
MLSMTEQMICPGTPQKGALNNPLNYVCLLAGFETFFFFGHPKGVVHSPLKRRGPVAVVRGCL